jgi:RNA polymerase sigma factor (sigma-70 family)
VDRVESDALPMKTAGSPPPDRVLGSDAELLARIADPSTDPNERSRAQAAFYSAHVRYLYGALQRDGYKLLRVAGVGPEDLVQETFHRAFERARTFDAGDTSHADQLRRRTRAWLGRIALNLLADHLRTTREVSATPYLERLSCDDIDREAPPSRDLSSICDALDRLSEREQDVLRVTALYQRAGEHQRLPNAVSAELAARWGTTNENIRAIRSRALKKLKELVTQRPQPEDVR